MQFLCGNSSSLELWKRAPYTTVWSEQVFRASVMTESRALIRYGDWRWRLPGARRLLTMFVDHGPTAKHRRRPGFCHAREPTCRCCVYMRSRRRHSNVGLPTTTICDRLWHKIEALGNCDCSRRTHLAVIIVFNLYAFATDTCRTHYLFGLSGRPSVRMYVRPSALFNFIISE